MKIMDTINTYIWKINCFFGAHCYKVHWKKHLYHGKCVMCGYKRVWAPGIHSPGW